MTYARKNQISLQDTPYYHLVGRCVRRAWLCGVDEYSGRDYSHRKHWVLERLHLLTSACAINVCAYAILSNHYHLVVRVDQTRAKHWSREEVVARWTSIFSMPPLIERWRSGQAGQEERDRAENLIDTWRERLYDVSWFEKCLNEHIARRANAEDRCTGHFWQSRFKSQALLDEAGLLTAMVYVDLNPIRAGEAATPEASEFTSIYERIREMRGTKVQSEGAPFIRIPLVAFRERAHEPEVALPFRFDHYLELVEWTGRVLQPDKRGFIDEPRPLMMQRLGIDEDAWRLAMRPGGNVFGRAMGRLDRLRLHASTLGQAWIRGLRQAQRLYLS